MISAFNVLGCEVTADADEIKKAYRRRMREVHPDVAGEESTALAKQVTNAKDLLDAAAEANALTPIVRQVVGRAEREEGQVEPVGSASGTVQQAFPDLAKKVVVEYLGSGRFAIWVYGRTLRTNVTVAGAVRVLSDAVGPQFRGSLSQIPVWVYASSVMRHRSNMEDLEEDLLGLVVGVEQRRTRRGTPVAEPRAGTQAEAASLSEETKQAIEAQDWRGIYAGYVIVGAPSGTGLARGGPPRANLFRAERVKGRIDFQWIGSYEGTDAALMYLRRNNIVPDVVPVWLVHAIMGGEPTRIGAA